MPSFMDSSRSVRSKPEPSSLVTLYSTSTLSTSQPNASASLSSSFFCSSYESNGKNSALLNSVIKPASNAKLPLSLYFPRNPSFFSVVKYDLFVIFFHDYSSSPSLYFLKLNPKVVMPAAITTNPKVLATPSFSPVLGRTPP